MGPAAMIENVQVGGIERGGFVERGRSGSGMIASQLHDAEPHPAGRVLRFEPRLLCELVMRSGETVQLVVQDAGEQRNAAQARLQRRRLVQLGQRLFPLTGRLQCETETEVTFRRAGLQPKKLSKIRNPSPPTAFSQSSVSPIEEGFRVAILRNSTLAAECQNQSNRQQPRGKMEHKPKHSRCAKDRAENARRRMST